MSERSIFLGGKKQEVRNQSCNLFTVSREVAQDLEMQNLEMQKTWQGCSTESQDAAAALKHDEQDIQAQKAGEKLPTGLALHPVKEVIHTKVRLPFDTRTEPFNEVSWKGCLSCCLL